MHWKKSDLLFLPVGGSEEIGMNANLYHYEDKWILIDLGISFPDETDLGIDVLLPDFEFIKSLGDDGCLQVQVGNSILDYYSVESITFPVDDLL